MSRGIRFGIAGLLALVVWVVAPGAIAQIDDQSKIFTSQSPLTVVPNTLMIAGTRGTTETRHLIFKASREIQDIKLIPLDLSRVDGLDVFPSSALSFHLPQKSGIAGGDLRSVPIQFNLQEIAVSGEYSGILLVRYNSGEETVPITMKVRDPIGWALMPLVVGVVLGYSLALYQVDGADRDKILVQVGRLRTDILGDREFETAFTPLDSSQIWIHPFHSKINALLRRVDTYLENKQWSEAREAANQARSVWDKWVDGKLNWLRLLSFKRDELESRFDQDLPITIPYGRSVQKNLEDIVSQIADFDSPQVFSNKLEAVKLQIERYLEGQQLLGLLIDLGKQVSEDNKGVWRTRAQALQNRLDYLLPTEEAYTQWRQEVEQSISKLEVESEVTEVAPGNQEAIVISTRDSRDAKEFKTPVLGLPPLTATVDFKRSQQAARQLRWAGASGHGVAILFLSLLGLNQLYGANLTFGANPIGDYFSLLAWGFGAEVSRESVTRVLQGLGIPGVK